MKTDNEMLQYSLDHEKNKNTITFANDQFMEKVIDKEELLCRMRDVWIPLVEQFVDNLGLT